MSRVLARVAHEHEIVILRNGAPTLSFERFKPTVKRTLAAGRERRQSRRWEVDMADKLEADGPLGETTGI
jgi:hypothetical protein